MKALASGFGVGYLVDDFLDEDDPYVDAFGEVGQEFGDEVIGGGEGEAGGVAAGCGRKVRAFAGDVEVGDFEVDGETEKVGVVDHAFAVVSLGPADLGDGVKDAPADDGVGHAVVVRVLVKDRWDEEGAEEFAGEVFTVADADNLGEAVHAGAVIRVGVGAYGDGGVGHDGDGVEGIEQVFGGEAGFFFRSEGLDLWPVDEAGEEVDERLGRAGGQLFGWDDGRQALRRLGWRRWGRKGADGGDEAGTCFGEGEPGGFGFGYDAAWSAPGADVLDDGERSIRQRSGGVDGLRLSE